MLDIRDTSLAQPLDKSNAGYSGSIAIGSQASTGTTTNSVAIGINSTVNGNGGIAIGNGLVLVQISVQETFQANLEYRWSISAIVVSTR